jgi:hypothetical protein
MALISRPISLPISRLHRPARCRTRPAQAAVSR